MNELNTNPILAAILAALNEHIDARVKAILETQPKPEVNVEVDMDKLRELVAPLVGSMVEAKIEEAIVRHEEVFDHESYDNVVSAVDDLPDFDDFVSNDDLPDFDDFITKSDLESQMSDAIQEAVGNLTFDITVR